MTDKEQIIEKLEKNIGDRDPKEQQLLQSICAEIFEEYKRESVKGISLLLQGKINPLKSEFDSAHNSLLKKMGL